MSDVIISQDKTPWYQWDIGLTVTVSGGAMTESDAVYADQSGPRICGLRESA